MNVIDIQLADILHTEVDTSLVEQAVNAVLAAEGQTEACEVSILLTDDAKLQTMNAQYRGIDAPTDVLSFAAVEEQDGPAFAMPPGMPRYLGDLAISVDRMLAQAAEYGHSPARELAFLTVHGVLHLLGYDHERSPEDAARMRTREEAVLQSLGLPRA